MKLTRTASVGIVGAALIAGSVAAPAAAAPVDSTITTSSTSLAAETYSAIPLVVAVTGPTRVLAIQANSASQSLSGTVTTTADPGGTTSSASVDLAKVLAPAGDLAPAMYTVRITANAETVVTNGVPTEYSYGISQYITLNVTKKTTKITSFADGSKSIAVGKKLKADSVKVAWGGTKGKLSLEKRIATSYKVVKTYKIKDVRSARVTVKFPKEMSRGMFAYRIRVAATATTTGTVTDSLVVRVG
jgi:hypothetical protein